MEWQWVRPNYMSGDYLIRKSYTGEKNKRGNPRIAWFVNFRNEEVCYANTLREAKEQAEFHKLNVPHLSRKNPSSYKRNALPIIEERHFIGQVLLENLEHLKDVDLTQCDFGIQTHNDGRVWICLNGIAFLRFKPLITDPELVPMFPLKGNDDSK